MYCSDGDLFLQQFLQDTVCAMASARKYDYLVPFGVFLEKPAEKIVLVVLLNAHKLLVDRIHGRGFRGYHNLDWILYQLARKLQDLRGKSR